MPKTRSTGLWFSFVPRQTQSSNGPAGASHSLTSRSWGPVVPGGWFGLIGLILLVLGCSQNSEKIGKNETPPPPPRPLATQFDTPRAEETERDRLGRGTQPGVSGEITIAPELTGKIGPDAVLFVFARRPSGGPVAAKRLSNPEFPVRFFLGQEAVMFAGEDLPAEIEVEARISQSGTAGPASPGDLSGTAPDNPLKVGDSQVHDIVIDTVH